MVFSGWVADRAACDGKVVMCMGDTFLDTSKKCKTSTCAKSDAKQCCVGTRRIKYPLRGAWESTQETKQSRLHTSRVGHFKGRLTDPRPLLGQQGQGRHGGECPRYCTWYV